MAIKTEKEGRGVSENDLWLEQKAYWRVKGYVKQVWEKNSKSKKIVWIKVSRQRRLDE